MKSNKTINKIILDVGIVLKQKIKVVKSVFVFTEKVCTL